MSDPRVYRLEVEKAYAERARQAGFYAMEQLKSELLRCVTYEQYCAWWQRVDELAERIIARAH